MFDLFLGLRQTVEGGAQDKAEVTGSQPLFKGFLGFWSYVMGMGMSAYGFTHA